MDKAILDVLACPVTKGRLIYDQAAQELLCKSARLAYPIRDGILVLKAHEARHLTAEEVEKLQR